MWYFWSGRKRETEFGFWKSKGEACEIYSTPSVSGFRKTLEFYEGKSPDGQKTNWVMQKYTITEKLISKPVYIIFSPFLHSYTPFSFFFFI